MIWVIFLTLLCMAALASCVGMFLRIRVDIQELIHDKQDQLDVCERMLCDLVTKKQMESYLEKIDSDTKELLSLKDKFTKEKWKNFHQAFGGKEEESNN